jgi:Uma2 family endonuclease
MATTNQHGGEWAEVNVPVVPTSMSEQEFEAWVLANEGVRAEWVDGEVQMMSPASFEHCDLNLWLGHLLLGFVEERRLGAVVGPEFTIRLRGGQVRRVPDLLFVAESRRSSIRPTYFDGPPDLVIELVSNDSQSRDYRDKYLEYEGEGVREYWIVDPFSKRVEVYRLGDGEKFTRIAESEGRMTSTVLDGFYLRNEWLWASPRPTVRSVLKEMGVE